MRGRLGLFKSTSATSQRPPGLYRFTLTGGLGQLQPRVYIYVVPARTRHVELPDRVAAREVGSRSHT